MLISSSRVEDLKREDHTREVFLFLHWLLRKAMVTSSMITQRDESSPTIRLFREKKYFRASATRNYSHCPSDSTVSRLFSVLPGFPCGEKAQAKMEMGIKLWTKPICSLPNWSLCQQLPKVADWRKNNLRIEGKLCRISLHDWLFQRPMLWAGAVRHVS